MTHSPQPIRHPRLHRGYLALAILAFAILSGVVFAAWANNGPQILLTLGSNALAWCF